MVSRGEAIVAFAYEDWARENIVRAFVVIWVAVVLIWLILDWLGNPNRGRFRPQGPRRGRGLRGRFRAWVNQRDDRDADIRETLRTTYGKSSLRYRWSNVDETGATAHDESRLSPVPRLVEVGTVVERPPPALLTDTLENEWELDVDIETDGEESEPGDATSQPPSAASVDHTTPGRGWRVGDDPQAQMRSGQTPSRKTVRARAWKNEVPREHGVGERNTGRMMRGRPPRRYNPLAAKIEMGKIDISSDDHTFVWPTTGIDPFADGSAKHEPGSDEPAPDEAGADEPES